MKSLTEAGGRCPPDALLRWRRSLATATLFQHPSNVVVQVAHRRFPLRGRGEEASGSASIAAIRSNTAAKFSSDWDGTGATSFAGLPLWRLIGFLRMLDFPSSNVVQRRQSAAVCCRGVNPFG